MDDTLKEFIKNGLDADAALSARSVLVIGGPDTGKTTLARALAAQMDNAALVDLDMGQSNVGPPATVAWGRSSGDGEVRAEEFYFTGSLSPPGSLLPTLAGARYMLDCALAACERAIIDTTGLVAGPVGLVLKQYKIELLSPDVVVALERGGELGHILSSFVRVDRPLIQRVAPPAGARRRDAEQRAAYRAKRFEEYFRASRLIEVDLNDVDVRYTGGALDSAAGLVSRVVSLRRGTREDLALGVIERFTPGDGGVRGVLLVRTPLARGAHFTSVVIGLCSIRPEALGHG